MKESRPSYFSIIPSNVRYDKELCPSAKLLYGEITSLSDENGECRTSNSYFAELYQVEVNTIRRWIVRLKTQGYIFLELIKGDDNSVIERVISIVPPLPSFSRGGPPLFFEGRAPSFEAASVGASAKIKNKNKNKSYQKQKQKQKLPTGLQETWEEWISYRKSKNFTISDRALDAHIKKLSSMEIGAAIATIHKSIRKGWQGIFTDEDSQLESNELEKWRNRVSISSQKYYRAAKQTIGTDMYLPHQRQFSDLHSLKTDMLKFAEEFQYSQELDSPLWKPFEGWVWKKYVELLCKRDSSNSRFYRK